MLFTSITFGLIQLLKVVFMPLASVYIVACFYLIWRQTRMIFFPSPIIEKTPAFLNLDYEDVWLLVPTKSGKSERLHGWWVPADSPSAGVLLYLHGNGINIGANVNHASRFHRLGLDVLLIDYRGFGKSEGAFPSETTVYQDGEIAWNYLVKERHVNPQDIFLYGHSLGGALAIELAKRHPEAGAAIIEGSFTSIRDMVDFRHKLLTIFPIDWILHQQFKSLEKVGEVKIPLLFIHGLADNFVPANMSQQLFDAAREPKQLVLVPNANHTDLAKVAGESYFDIVGGFIKQVKSRQNQRRDLSIS